MGDLNWNETHTINSQHKYCYCGKDRNLLEVSLQCRYCKNWFHAKCTSVKNVPDLLFVTNYVFVCNNCTEDRVEQFERTTAGWKEICSTAIANLTLHHIINRLNEEASNSNNKDLFDSRNAELMQTWQPEQYYFYKKQLVPYIDEHWHSLCTERARTNTWWATVGSCLYSSEIAFTARDEKQRSAASEFRLADPNLWHIRPNTHQVSGKIPSNSTSQNTASTATATSNAVCITDDIHGKTKKRKTSTSTPNTPLSSSSPASRSSSPFPPVIPPVRAPATSTTQSAAAASSSTEPSTRSITLTTTNNTTHSIITASNTDHPFNKFGFKYTPCEPSILPLIAYQQSDYKAYYPQQHQCVLSLPDKSPYVYVSKDGLTLTTEKGFRMCRANVGVKEGNWFWEAIIQEAAGAKCTCSEKKYDAHVRLGFARREACLNAPVGYDGYSYGYRDRTGDKIFCSRPEKFGEGFQKGDVIGLYISLPPRQQQKEHEAEDVGTDNKGETTKKRFHSASRRRIPIAYKDHLWFEEKDYRSSKEMEALADPYRKKEDLNYEPRVLKGSYITVYKNGVNQGVMFTDLFDFEDFGRLPETILAKKAKKKRKYTKKDDQHSNNAYNGSSSLDGQNDLDSGYGSKYWTDDPPVEDDGTLGYYPAVSVYKGGTVTCNFGPHFQYPPTDQKEPWRPICERFDDYMAEECVWDILDEVSRSFKK